MVCRIIHESFPGWFIKLWGIEVKQTDLKGRESKATEHSMVTTCHFQHMPTIWNILFSSQVSALTFSEAEELGLSGGRAWERQFHNMAKTGIVMADKLIWLPAICNAGGIDLNHR